MRAPHFLQYVKEITVYTRRLPSPGLRNRNFIDYEESFDPFFASLADALCAELASVQLQHFRYALAMVHVAV